MISTLQVPAAAPFVSASTGAVTFTSSSIRSSEALYGASGSIEVTNVMISAMRRELSKLVSCYQTSENTAAARAECAGMACPDCGQRRCSKGNQTPSRRTVVGQLRVRSPRMHHCVCRPHETKTFSPLAELLPNHTLPELLFLETKWASLMSYGMTSKLLQDVLPIEEPVNTFTIRQHVADVAERLEQEFGDEQFCFVEGCQRSWDELPSPDGPLMVWIDGAYVRGQHKQGQFEVIAGKSLLSFKRDQEGKQQLSARCFAWVRTYDEKPKRRLFELLQSQGMQPNQQVNFLSDGGEDVRNVQLDLNPQAEHLLDWFHLTMRLTVLNQTAKGQPERIGEGEDQYELRPGVLKDLERIKWHLWHSNGFQA